MEDKPKIRQGAPLKYGEPTQHFACKIPISEYKYLSDFIYAYLKKCEVKKLTNTQ